MAERALTGGLTYALPTNRYIAPSAPVEAPQQGATPFFRLPKEDQDLAYVEGLTDKYYDTRGKIEAYAMDMWKKYGVDVTQPDYTQPGGGIPFKSYQKLATELLITANDLKTSMDLQKQQQPYFASGAIRAVEGFDPTAQPINRLSPDQQFFSTKLLPEIEQANDILRTAVYTEDDFKRFKDQVLDPLTTRLTQEMNRPGITPAERERLQYNINALVQMPRTTPYAAFQDYGRGRKSTIEIDLLRKVTNAAQGKWAPGTYTPSTDENGNPILVNKAFEGEQAGEHVYEDAKGLQKRVPRILDGLVKKSDGVYFTFKQEAGVKIPPIKVSSKKGDEVTASIIASNPKYGSVPKMYEAMREMQLADETGSLINEKVLAGEEFDTPDPSVFGAGVVAEKKRLKTLIEEGEKNDPGGNILKNRPRITLTLPSGENVTLVKHRVGDGWFLEGEDDNENFTHMEWEDIQTWLAGERYFDQFLSQTPGATPQDEALNQLRTGIVTVPDLQPLPNETQAQYDLRVIKYRRAQKSKQ